MKKWYYVSLFHPCIYRISTVINKYCYINISTNIIYIIEASHSSRPRVERCTIDLRNLLTHCPSGVWPAVYDILRCYIYDIFSIKTIILVHIFYLLNLFIINKLWQSRGNELINSNIQNSWGDGGGYTCTIGHLLLAYLSWGHM